eukprot:sb/3468693/
MLNVNSECIAHGSMSYIQSDPDLPGPDIPGPRFTGRINFPRFRKLTVFHPDIPGTPIYRAKSLPPTIPVNRGPTHQKCERLDLLVLDLVEGEEGGGAGEDLWDSRRKGGGSVTCERQCVTAVFVFVCLPIKFYSSNLYGMSVYTSAAIIINNFLCNELVTFTESRLGNTHVTPSRTGTLMAKHLSILPRATVHRLLTRATLLRNFILPVNRGSGKSGPGKTEYTYITCLAPPTPLRIKWGMTPPYRISRDI